MGKSENVRKNSGNPVGTLTPRGQERVSRERTSVNWASPSGFMITSEAPRATAASWPKVLTASAIISATDGSSSTTKIFMGFDVSQYRDPPPFTSRVG